LWLLDRHYISCTTHSSGTWRNISQYNIDYIRCSYSQNHANGENLKLFPLLSGKRSTKWLLIIAWRIFKILRHKRYANQNDTKIPSHYSQNDCHQENKQQHMLVKMQGKKEFLHTVCGNVTLQLLWKSVWSFFKELIIGLPYYPAITKRNVNKHTIYMSEHSCE
jgi:hypothetical protein